MTKIYSCTYKDLDGNSKTLRFNATNSAYAMLFATKFCNRFGFKLLTVVF